MTTSPMSFVDVIRAVDAMMWHAHCACRKPRHVWLGPDACCAVSECMDYLEAAGITKPTGETAIMGLPWVPMKADGVALAFE